MNAPIGSACYEILPALPHDSDAWHAARRLSLGASEVAIVLGVSKWQSRLGLYLQKTSDEAPERQDSEHLRWGHLLERAIVDEAALRAGVDVDCYQPSLRSTVHPWATATPDAMTTAGEPVEAKNISTGYDEAEWSEAIPEHYRLQCQHQMLVTGAQRCLFAALLWGRRLVWEWVPRDEETIRRIAIAGAEFMRRVRELDEPPADGHPREREALAARATEDEPIELFADEADELVATYHVVRAERLATEKRAKSLKVDEDAAANALVQLMGTHRRAFLSDGTQLRWKTIARKGYEVKPCEVTSFEIKAPKG